jgi:hypothetical protein
MKHTVARDRKADPGGRGNKIAKAGRVRAERTEDWSTWSPCEMYGHLFHDGWCVDCFEVQQ